MTNDFKSKVALESQKYKTPEETDVFEEGVVFGLNAVWHEASDMPKEKRTCLIMWDSGGDASLSNFEIVISDPLTRRFITRSYPHKTGRQHIIHDKNTVTVYEYQDRRDYIPFSDIDKWCYLDNLI